MIKLKLLLSLKIRGFQLGRSWLRLFIVMGINNFLRETNGHLSETLMETETIFKLVIALNMDIFLENLTKTIMDGQVGQIQQVRKLFAPYQSITQNICMQPNFLKKLRNFSEKV